MLSAENTVRRGKPGETEKERFVSPQRFWEGREDSVSVSVTESSIDQRSSELVLTAVEQDFASPTLICHCGRIFGAEASLPWAGDPVGRGGRRGQRLALSVSR